MENLIVKENIHLNDQYFLMKIISDKPLPDIKPGQFVEIRVDNTQDSFLRRPISIHYVDYTKNELWLLIQKVGNGTAKLAEYTKGQSINIVYPLGNGYTIPISTNTKTLLIGGGVGIAPLLMLGAILYQKQISTTFLLGARSKKDLLEIDKFSKFGTVYITTEDGSLGEKGFVTQHSILKNNFDKIYTCGPTPMMKAVASYAKGNNIDCEVSLENKMACGIGACLCCVEDTKEGHKCVCSEGPVFNIKDLKW